jgi:hypothetical protein
MTGSAPPDDRLREAIHIDARQVWIASSLTLLAMTNSANRFCLTGKSLRFFRNGLSSPFCKNISVLA